MPMSGAELVQSVATGLANGAIYGLVALGFSLVFRLTRVLSFAHGDLVVAATLTGVFVTVGSTPVVQSLSPAASVAFVVVALAGGAVLGGVVYVVCVRPFAQSTAVVDSAAIGWVAALVGAGLVLREGFTLLFPRVATAVPDPLHLGSRVVDLPGGATVPVRVAWVLVIGLVVGVL
ncbi:MAG: hypothetical protein ABR520_01195, partial [Mycobacteriales bacterium]